MSLPTQPYKGARDFYPPDKRLQKYIFKMMRKTVERFGYEEYDAPILEPTELYLVKGSQEIIDQQTYTFTDRGDRSVTIRTEMTPTVSRLVAGKRQELAYPLRWYSIPNLWRYERMQRGRLREFWQLNVDIFGVEGVAAEHEIILVADQIMKAYGATHDMYEVRINSRKLMDFLMLEYLALEEVQAQTLAKLIDRMHKVSPEEFSSQVDAVLAQHQREEGLGDKIEAVLKVKKIEELPSEIQSHTSVQNLKQLLEMLQNSHVTNAIFDITIMRGFDYYTDIVFEVFDRAPENNRSMFGGGRYDGLVAQFGVEPVPTVGFGMGDVPLQLFLESHDLIPKLKTEADVYVVLIGDIYQQALPTLARLREMGLNVAVDMSGRKPEKQLKSAAKQQIRHAVIIGEQELAEEQFTLRDLTQGQEETHSLERIVSIVKDHRS
jgi:histidyl-tRNA synthetase